MRSKVIALHTTPDGKTNRWCVKCDLHVDEKGEIDQDFYTARQYLKFTAVPVEQRCDHAVDRPDTKEELLKRVEISFTGNQRDILREIIRRLL